MGQKSPRERCIPYIFLEVMMEGKKENTHRCICTLAGPWNWLFRPLLPEREPEPGLDPELGLEPVLPLLLCSHSSCRVEKEQSKENTARQHNAHHNTKKFLVFSHCSIWFVLLVFGI